MDQAEPQVPKETDQRVVKLLLPLALIRTMDRLLVEGVGGFTTRNEFAREALESYILELTHDPAPAEPTRLGRGGQSRLSMAPTLLDAGQPELFDLEPAPPIIALAPMPAEVDAIAGEAQIIGDTLFGMHNRDYPSLWAARRLVDYLAEGPLGFDEFAERATEEAWAFAEALRPLEMKAEQKLTALFPTNHKKRQTAASAFRVFAIGTVASSGREIHAEGPLFLWRVIDVAQGDGGILVGLTESGQKLLTRLAGLTVVPPHRAEEARVFMQHLRDQARVDWWGFEQVLGVVANGPRRAELVEAFRAARSDWSEGVAATNAQGYIARAREWGLIKPKVIDGRYELTELGAELLAEGAAE